MKKYLPYVIYPLLAVVALALQALAWLLAPFLAFYSVLINMNTLPGHWQWWSTVDATLDGGMEQFEYPDYSQRGPFIVWLYRTRWICRNPAQGFMYHLFSVLGWKLYQAQGYRMLVFSIALRFNFTE